MKKGEVAKDILIALGLVGLIVLSLTMSNLLVALKPFLKNRKYNNSQLKRSLRHLERRGLVSLGIRNGNTRVVITKEGKKKILEYKLEEMKIKPQRRWDRKWRVVIFDIPEYKKQSRLIFKDKLRELGFVLLQKSVWVCPYPCEDEVEYLKEVYEVYPYVKIITAEKIDFQDNLIKIFNL